MLVHTLLAVAVAVAAWSLAKYMVVVVAAQVVVVAVKRIKSAPQLMVELQSWDLRAAAAGWAALAGIVLGSTATPHLAAALAAAAAHGVMTERHP